MIKLKSTKGGLTPHQHAQVECFLHLFADIEALLKAKLKRGSDDRSAVTHLISLHLDKNRLWVDSADELRALVNIRNVLTHQRSSDYGYPLAVTQNSLAALERIKKTLNEPELAGQRFQKDVKSVSIDESLATVVKLAFQHGFSQFPVLAEKRFVGLITETEITRWLGRRTSTHGSELNLANVCVRAVLREKDPDQKDGQIYRFAGLDDWLEEVISLFARQPMLEVVLLTTGGTNKTEIAGIVTQWDAARYPALT